MSIVFMNELHLHQLLTVIIATKNRWDNLQKAITSILNQTMVPAIIVMDDGSTDDTTRNIKQSFPDVRVYRFEHSQGYIVRRNEAVALAKTPYVLSIDDDCVLSASTTIREIAEYCLRFQCKALAWPYVDVNISCEIKSDSPANGLWQTYTFKGCSFVVHREKFLEVGGFRASFFHQGEEEDYCIRLLEHGYPVVLGRGSAIHHIESPVRSWKRMDFYGSRNLMLFTFFNVPWVFLPVNLAASAFNSILYGFKIKRPYTKTLGVVYGIIEGVKMSRKQRRPVSIHTFLRYRKLKKGPVLLLS